MKDEKARAAHTAEIHRRAAPISSFIPHPSSLVLIGFMGSGKSSIGRRLASALRLPFIDLDAEIEKSAGMRIPSIFAAEGEAGFRRYETQSLRAVLDKSAVIASGGGLVTREENRSLLHAAARNGARIVYLRAQADTLAKRIRRQPGTRPLIDGHGTPLDMEATRLRVEELLSQRAAWYEECATLTVDTDKINADGVVRHIVRRLDATRNRGKAQGTDPTMS